MATRLRRRLLQMPVANHVPAGIRSATATMMSVVRVEVPPSECAAFPRTTIGVSRTVILPCGPMPDASRWWCPGDAVSGTVTVAEKVPSGPALVLPTVYGCEWKVIVTMAPGMKPDPRTVTRLPVCTV